MDAVGLEKEKPQIRKNVLSSNTYMNIHTADGSEIRRSPVEVGSLFHMWQGFSTIQVGWSQLLKPLKLRKNSSFLAGSKPNLVLLLPFLIHTYNNIWPTTSMGGTVYFPTSTIKIHIYHKYKYKYHKHLHLLRHFCHPTCQKPRYSAEVRKARRTAARIWALLVGFFHGINQWLGGRHWFFDWILIIHCECPMWYANFSMLILSCFHVDIVMLPCDIVIMFPFNRAKLWHFENLDFPENSRGPISLTIKTTFRGPKTCEVAIIWPDTLVYRDRKSVGHNPYRKSIDHISMGL